jgi:hypothetical protein
MRLTVLIVAASMFAMAAHSHAQPAPTTISCTDVTGRPVRSVQTTKGVIARATIDDDGRPVIEYDARPIDGVGVQQRLFVYAHECGHHALGHDSTHPFTPAQEQEADCHGIQAMIRRTGFTSNDVMILQGELRDLAPAAARRLPWRSRTYDLEACLPDVVSRRQAAGRAGEANANDCVAHNDADNAILNASRDRLTIEGAYTVRNRCARDLTCTFAIELGTLPDTDADAGSWRNFRVQKTLTEQHTLPAEQGRSIEFRFRGSIETARDGESIDFRVTPSCR